jgi:hypothetical protein
MHLAIWLAMKAFGSRIAAGFAWAFEKPVRLLAIALALSFGISAYLWRQDNRHIGQRDAARAQIAALVKASKENARLAIEQRRAWEAKSTTAAKEAQERYETDATETRTATDSFIRANRVRAGICRGNAPAPGEGQGASVPATVPTPALVAVSDIDVQACSRWTLIGVNAHNWAVDQIKAGIAEPVE